MNTASLLETARQRRLVALASLHDDPDNMLPVENRRARRKKVMLVTFHSRYRKAENLFSVVSPTGGMAA